MGNVKDEERADQFTKAYHDYSDAIFRLCYFRVFDRERAKELAQETFMKTWKYIAEQNGQIENMRAFLYRTARNLIIDESRKHKTTSLEELFEKGFDPTGTAGSMEARVEVSLIVQRLESIPEPYRLAVALRYIEGLSPNEIGEALNLPSNTISVHIHRGIEKLRTLISESPTTP